MNFKKAFSLIELLLVVIVIGILVYAMRGAFSYKHVEAQKFDTCFITTYSKVSKFMEEALLQKMFYTGNTLTGVNFYNIEFDKANQRLILTYSGENTKKTDILNYNGTVLEQGNSCYTKTYYTYISGNSLRIEILPGLQADVYQTPVKLFTGNSTTYTQKTQSIYMYYCQGNECKEKYRLTFTPSTYLFSTSYCIKLGNDNHCIKWSE